MSVARKRKKSKGRKKRRKDEKAAASPEASADDTSVPAADEEDASPSEDDVEEDAAADTPDADTREDEPAVAAVIEVDDDLEDPAARAELIAAAAGLAADEGSDAVDDEAQATADELSEEAETPDEADEASGEDDDEGASSGEAGDDEEPAGRNEGGEEDETPLIGRDALIALSQFRDEGVATVPEELVLDLGEATSPDERDRLLAAALAHVEMQEAIYRVPADSASTRHWKSLIAAGVFVLAVLLAALPPDLLVPARPEPLSESDRLRGIRTALLVQAEQIEAFRVREERLPASLGEVDTALPGIRFVKSSNRLYQLVAHTPDGDAIIFDSAAPDEAFEDIGSPFVPEDPS